MSREAEPIDPREMFEEFWQSWLEPEATAYRSEHGYRADVKGDLPKLPTVLALYGLILCGVAAWLAAQPILLFIDQQGIHFSALVRLLIALPILLYGLRMLWANLMKLIGYVNTESAELILLDSPQRLGQTLQLSYRLRTTGRTKIAQVRAFVRCVEQIRRPRRKRRHIIEEHVVWEQALPVVRQDVALDDFSVSNYEVLLPHQLPPSFEAANNKIIWRIEIEPKTSGLGNIRHSYRLQVLPEVLI